MGKANWIISSAALTLGGMIASHFMGGSSPSDRAQADSTLLLMKQLDTTRSQSARPGGGDANAAVQTWVEQSQRQQAMESDPQPKP